MQKLSLTLLILCILYVPTQADLVSQPYIAGEFNGWNPGGTPMTETAPGSGIWTYTFTGLAPDQWEEFKITPGDWSETKPAANSWFNADANGEVTITFNTNIVSDGWVPEQFRIGTSTEPGTWSLVGDYNGWNNNDPTQVMTEVRPGSGVYSITQTLPAGSFNLKPTWTGTWNAIGTDGRSIDAWNYNLQLASASEVTVYVNAFNNTIGIGGVADIAFLYQAFNPSPAHGAVVGTGSVTELSWTNPDPNDPADLITSDVYFLDAGTSLPAQDPNMGPDVTDPGVIQIADDITDATVALPGSVLPLQDDHYYYWAVHSTDPHADPNGNPVTTPGKIWHFFTGDSAPVPGKPADQYMWLAQDDSAIPGGDGPSNVRYFQVTASYTDDGKSPIVDANMVNLNWDWADGELGIVEVSDIHDPQTQTVTAVYRTIYEEDGDPDNTTVLPGYWQIRLEVTDGTGKVNGIAGIHRIFETCGEAAAADPEDSFDGYYDINRDCIISLPDFAEFAEMWLYRGEKYE